MRTLALVVLFSVAVNAQYPIQAEKGTKVKQSRLSELSPRAGPDRPKTAPVPLSVLTPLTALGGLGREVTISQEAQKSSHLIQPRVIGVTPGQIGSRVYALTPGGGTVLSQLQKQGVKGGHNYAVREPSQEVHHEKTSEGYRIVLQGVPTKNQPLEIQQFQNPVVGQHYLDSQTQQPLPLLFRSPQQYFPRNSPTLSFYQEPGEQQQDFSLQEQIYEQKPNVNYVQTNPSITAVTALPPSAVHVPSINSPSYHSTTGAIFPDLNKQNLGTGIYKGVLTYEDVNPTTYGHTPQYYSYPLDDPPKTPARGRLEAETDSFYSNQFSQATTTKPLLPISRVIPVEYQSQTSTSGDVGVSRGLYEPNAALVTLSSGGKVESPQPFGIFTYFPQQLLEGSSTADLTYNGNGGSLRNPIEYASPFARQELLELRQKKGI